MYNEINKEQGSVSLIVAIIFGVLFVASSIFGVWSFIGRQDFKDNVDSKIADATAVAVQEAETAKESEFIEREKLPTRTYTGPSTYGSLSFEYPKTWSVYSEESSSGTVLDVYAHPRVVPGLRSGQPYGLRIEIISRQYDSEISRIQRAVDNGDLRSRAFRPDKVESVLGIRVDGLLERDVTGAAVYLPLRDRTIKMYTEVPQLVNDFNNIVLPSLTFNP